MPLLKTLLMIDAVIVAVAVYIGENPYQQFDEGGLVTYVSFFQLLAVAAMALQVYVRRQKEPGAHLESASHAIWFWIAMGFTFLAFDELFLIHENIDLAIHKLFKARETAASGRLDDIIVAGYFTLGIILLYAYRDELARFKFAAKPAFLMIALGILSLVFEVITYRKILLDKIIGNPNLVDELYVWINVAEDSLKIFAEGTAIAVLNMCADKVTSPENE